jgi:hypothetical protein
VIVVKVCFVAKFREAQRGREDEGEGVHFVGIVAGGISTILGRGVEGGEGGPPLLMTVTACWIELVEAVIPRAYSTSVLYKHVVLHCTVGGDR